MSDGVSAAPPAGQPDPLWDDWDAPPLVPEAPELHLDVFDGPLDLLLDLAERERIDLSRISVRAMAEQFAAAMARFEKHVSLERRATWLVLAARLVQLRSLLLVPATPQAAAAWWDAERDLARLRELRFIKAAAAWLQARPQHGQDVLTRKLRGRDPRVASYMQVIEACLTLLEAEDDDVGAAPVYRPPARQLFNVPDALARMRATLAALTEPAPLTVFLPRLPQAAADRALLARSAVSSTLIAALELARTVDVVLDGGNQFETATLMAADRG